MKPAQGQLLSWGSLLPGVSTWQLMLTMTVSEAALEMYWLLKRKADVLVQQVTSGELLEVMWHYSRWITLRQLPEYSMVVSMVQTKGKELNEHVWMEFILSVRRGCSSLDPPLNTFWIFTIVSHPFLLLPMLPIHTPQIYSQFNPCIMKWCEIKSSRDREYENWDENKVSQWVFCWIRLNALGS